MEKVLNAPEAADSRPDALDEAARICIDPAFGGGWAARPNEKLARDRFIRPCIGRAEGRAAVLIPAGVSDWAV